MVDATAGFGRDGWAMACAGTSVTLIERNPVLYVLLRDGWERRLASLAVATIPSCVQLCLCLSVEQAPNSFGVAWNFRQSETAAPHRLFPVREYFFAGALREPTIAAIAERVRLVFGDSAVYLERWRNRSDRTGFEDPAQDPLFYNLLCEEDYNRVVDHLDRRHHQRTGQRRSRADQELVEGELFASPRQVWSLQGWPHSQMWVGAGVNGDHGMRTLFSVAVVSFVGCSVNRRLARGAP